jgi:hypothetical protein
MNSRHASLRQKRADERAAEELEMRKQELVSRKQALVELDAEAVAADAARTLVLCARHGTRPRVICGSEPMFVTADVVGSCVHMQLSTSQLGSYATADAELKAEQDRVDRVKASLAGGVPLRNLYADPVIPWNESRPVYAPTDDMHEVSVAWEAASRA